MVSSNGDSVAGRTGEPGGLTVSRTKKTKKTTDVSGRLKYVICVYSCWVVPILVFLLSIHLFRSGLPELLLRCIFAVFAIACAASGFTSGMCLPGIKTGRDAAIIGPGAVIGLLANLWVGGVAIWCLIMVGVVSFG
jgi:hypothetical protein